MKHAKKLTAVAVAAILAVCSTAWQQAIAEAEFVSTTKAPKPEYFASLQGQDETTVGGVLISPTKKGLLVYLDVYHLPEGWHSLHFHGVGDCSDHGDHFKKSGGHAAREGQEHGYFSEAGPHSGDLPNFYVGPDHRAKVHVYTTDMTLEQLTDADGTAMVVHAKADDYASQPAGDAGERLACGVVAKVPANPGQ